MILTAQAVSLIYQFWLHTEWIDRLGPLEWIFNTPSHHRVHHGRNVEYLDKNYGGILIVWDRLFGSFAEEKEKVVYGLTDQIRSINPLVVFFHGFTRLARQAWSAPGLRKKLDCLVRPPA